MENQYQCMYLSYHEVACSMRAVCATVPDGM
jgi:hypothetical protein